MDNSNQASEGTEEMPRMGSDGQVLNHADAVPASAPSQLDLFGPSYAAFMKVRTDYLSTRINKSKDMNMTKTSQTGAPFAEDRLTIDRIKSMLKICNGLVALTAERLGVTDKAIYYHIDKHIELQEYREHLKELRIDKTEKQLFSLIDEDKSVDAVKFHLETKAKKRGYVKSVTIRGDDEAPLILNIVPLFQNLPKRNDLGTIAQENVKTLQDETLLIGNKIVEGNAE